MACEGCLLYDQCKDPYKDLMSCDAYERACCGQCMEKDVYDDSIQFTCATCDKDLIEMEIREAAQWYWDDDTEDDNDVEELINDASNREEEDD